LLRGHGGWSLGQVRDRILALTSVRGGERLVIIPFG
jgi:hypothetical protein